MNIGIRGHDAGKNTPNLFFKNIKDLGFEYVQLVFKKAFVDEDGSQIPFTKENAKKIKPFLDESGVKVALLGAYFNPVHSNHQLRDSNIEYFKEHLKYASILGAKYVGTETGSYNDDKWTYNPKNQTEEGYQETMAVFKDLVKTAEEYKTTLLMEPAYGHVIYSVKQLKRAFDEINSEYFKVIIDIYNLCYLGNYQNYKEIFEEALSTFKDDIKILHLKDFIIKDDKLVQVGLGEGIVDYEFIVSTIKKYCPNATMVFEGVTGPSIPTSLELIKKLNK